MTRHRLALVGRYSRLGQATTQGRGPTFLLGTHQASWLWDDRVPVPLFVSRRRLTRYKRLYPATHPWAGPDQNFDDFQIILGKVRPPTSPHRAPNIHRF